MARAWTDGELLAAIRAAAAGEALPVRRYVEWRRAQPSPQPSHYLAWQRFGSWVAALEAAGLDPGGWWRGRRRWDEETVIEALRDAAELTGRPMRLAAYREWRRSLPDRLVVPTDQRVAEQFGGWRAAIAAAGVD